MAGAAPGILDLHKDEILRLFSASGSKRGRHGGALAEKVESWDSGEVSGPMFAGGLGCGLSEVNRVRLKALLDQALEDLEDQYEKLSEYVLAVRRVLNYLVGEKDVVEGSPSSCDSKKRPPHIDAAIKTVVDSLASESYEELKKEFQEILEDGGLQAQTALEQYSTDLCIKLEHTEQQIDDFSVAVVSKCREMTFIELQDLNRRIQMLPEKAMDRVAKIIKHPLSPASEDYEEIRVDLNRESNSAHWRLHYFSKLIETENKLSPG